MFEVLIARGDLIVGCAKFRALADALTFVDQFAGAESLAILYPDGRWHMFAGGQPIIRNRRRSARYRVSEPVELVPRGSGRRLRTSVCLDLSEGGVRLRVDAAEASLTPGVGVGVDIGLATRRYQAWVAAEVAWARGCELGLRVAGVADASELARWAREKRRVAVPRAS